MEKTQFVTLMCIMVLGFTQITTFAQADNDSSNSSLFGSPITPPVGSPNPWLPNSNPQPQPQRPEVRLVACSSTSGLACNAPFCLKVRTTAWDQLPSDLTETPEVYVQFTRQIRGQDGQPLPANWHGHNLRGYHFKVALAPGSNHEKSLWFQTDGGPLFFDKRFSAFLTYPDSLRDASPDDVPFDLALMDSRVTYPLTGESCENQNPSSWFLPNWW